MEAQLAVPQVPKDVQLGHELPEEVLVCHILPHLDDYTLANLACTTRVWRRTAGEVGLRSNTQTDACVAQWPGHHASAPTAQRICFGL